MTSGAEAGAEHLLLAVGIILAVGSVLGYLARRSGVPDIVLFLGAGIALGPDVSGILDIPAASTLSWTVVIFATSYILFDGGAALELRVVGRLWLSLVVIVTLGMAVTIVVTGLAAHRILNVPPAVGLLLGAAIAATDPATLVPVFRQMNVRVKVAQFVISESALNDPVGAITTFALLGVVAGHTGAGQLSLGAGALSLLLQAGLGLAIGAVLGYLVSVFIAHERYGFLTEFLPLVTVIVVIGGYLGASGLHASGFMAAFVAGVVMGNMRHVGLRLPRDEHARFEDFVGTTSLISRMFIFVLLGLQVRVNLLATFWWQGLAVVAVFMFVARPLTVLSSVLLDRRARWTWRELVLLSWTRETGVIPGALASILVATGAPHADVLAAVIFTAILVTIALQASTASWTAHRLGLHNEAPDQGAG
jgi:cell volume regulation protein A